MGSGQWTVFSCSLADEDDGGSADDANTLLDGWGREGYSVGMARRLRTEMRNGVYYVSSRGLEREGMVRDAVDAGKWFGLLDAVATRRRWRVFAFVLLPSHFHLLVETPDGDLSAGMHDLNAGYATAFNCRHGRRGPLLRGRFEAVLIQPGHRYWDISRHMHLNPVRVGQVKQPQDYPFGSCGLYLGTVLGPAWLAWREAMKGHGATMAEAQEAYARFLAEGVAKPPVSPLWAATDSVVLGSSRFVRGVLEWLDAKRLARGASVARALRRTDGVEAIERAVCTVFGVEERRLRERHRWRNEARAVALYLCRKWTAMGVRELGERFGGVTGQAVSLTARQVARDLAENTDLAERVGRCEAALGLGNT